MRRAPQAALVIDLCCPLGQAAEGAYVEAARMGNRPAIATIAEEVSDTELEYPLRDIGRLPIRAGIEVPASFGANLAGYDVAPPPVSSQQQRPPMRQPLHPKRKTHPRWPWVLAAAALIFVVVGGGVLAWTIKAGKDRTVALATAADKAAADKAAADKAAADKAAADKAAADKAAADKAAADKAAADKAAADKAAAEKAAADKAAAEKAAAEKAAAEKAAADKAAAEKAAAEKAAAEKAAAEKAASDPLCNFRGKSFPVPRYQYISPLHPDPSKSEWFPLLPIPASLKEYNISLVSSAKMFSEGWERGRLKRVASSHLPDIWDCILEKPTGMGGQIQTVRIARFSVDKGMLKIKWDEAIENAKLANLLRNCPLEITTPSCDAAVIYLRTPVNVSPIEFTELRAQNRIDRPLAVNDVPDLPVALEILPTLPTGIMKPEMVGEKPQTWLLHAEADRAICFRLQVEHTGREANVVLALTDLGVKLDENKPIFAYTVAAYIKQMEKEKQSLDSDKGNKESLPTKVHMSPADKKDNAKKISAIEEKIGDLVKRIEKAKEIERVYHELTGSVKLHYRIYLPIDKYNVDLIRTE